MSETASRKDAHLDLCATDDVEPADNRTLLDDVRLLHCAMPELALADIDLSTPLLGKRLKAPLLITGMTGGTERAMRINLELAGVAERHGLAFGVGSQRAMVESPPASRTYQVRTVAPNAVVLGNIGLAQAATLGVDGVRRLADSIGADGMAVHLNAAQELAQPEGDRAFRDGYATLEALARAFGERLLVKETGCGIGPDVARRLVGLGVHAIDVSGLGGTSWVKVEQLRAADVGAEIAGQFQGWGIPTAAAVASVRRAVGPSVCLVASGGLRSGLDLARALALGADLGGMALPLLRALEQGGVHAAERAVHVAVAALAHALLLTGCRRPPELRLRPFTVVGELRAWLEALDRV